MHSRADDEPSEHGANDGQRKAGRFRTQCGCPPPVAGVARPGESYSDVILQLAKAGGFESRFIGVIGANPAGTKEGDGSRSLSELSSRSKSRYPRGGRG